jgi:hypothetical protein
MAHTYIERVVSSVSIGHATHVLVGEGALLDEVRRRHGRHHVEHREAAQRAFYITFMGAKVRSSSSGYMGKVH